MLEMTKPPIAAVYGATLSGGAGLVRWCRLSCGMGIVIILSFRRIAKSLF